MSEAFQPPAAIPFQTAVHANSAFSVDSVFRFGLGFVQEAPRVAVLGGLVLVIAQLLPSFVGMCVSVGAVLATANDPQAAQTANLVGNLLQSVLQLFMLPVTFVVEIGLTAAAAEHARAGETSVRTLFVSVLPIVRALLYRLLVRVINAVVVMIAVLMPLALIGAVAFVTKQYAVGVVVGALWATVALTANWIVVGLGTQLGDYAAIVDDVWPIDALALSWRSASGARLTLFVTNLVFTVAAVLSVIFSFAVIGILPLIVLGPIVRGGMAIAWLVHTTPEEERRKVGFFQRHASDF